MLGPIGEKRRAGFHDGRVGRAPELLGDHEGVVMVA